MSEAPSTYLGLACAALVLASFVPGISDAATGSGAQHPSGEARSSLAKGDLLSAPRPAARTEVASIQVVGESGHRSISMRTRTGVIAYQADAPSGMSAATKDVVLPTLQDRVSAPTSAAPGPASAAQEVVPTQVAPPRKLPLGCERLVSVLVKSAERDRLGRCLA